MKPFPRQSWAILLVLLHLIVAPCATAMVLMPADADCQHCQTSHTPDACAADTAAMTSAMEAVAFDSGVAQPALLHPAPASGPFSAFQPPDHGSRSVAAHHSGDPPLYLVLGQLRI